MSVTLRPRYSSACCRLLLLATAWLNSPATCSACRQDNDVTLWAQAMPVAGNADTRRAHGGDS